MSDTVGSTLTGRFFAIEVKKRGNKPTPEQLEFLDRVRQANGIGDRGVFVTATAKIPKSPK